MDHTLDADAQAAPRPLDTDVGVAGLRCSICNRRLGQTLRFIEETGETPEPRQSWLLCAACDAAVHDQLDRSAVQSPMRVRVAVGLVASERTPAARRARFGQLSDPMWERVIFWSFALGLIVHLIVMIFVAGMVTSGR